MVEEMESDIVSVLAIIDAYQNLQRIKKSDDKDKEIDNQLKYLRAKLEICGVNLESLDENP